MRILYGVTGEGMGHATRSRVVIAHLLARQHTVHVVVSGRAFAFLKRSFEGHASFSIEEIVGFTLSYANNQLDIGDSIKINIKKAPQALADNLEAYVRFMREGFDPEAVISDFESWAYLFGITHGVPVISIDNMQVINRCLHDITVTDNGAPAFQIAKAAVKMKLPGAYHYLISSFFFPPVRKPRTTLVPPILRPEILAAQREPRDHILVYQTSSANVGLLAILKSFPLPFKVYGMGREAVEGNLTLCPFSQDGFVNDLSTARAVIAGGGYSLMSECVHLGVPLLSIPIKDQYEQELNARYLMKLGYGLWAATIDRAGIERFLNCLPRHEEALRSYPRHDNTMLFDCLDEVLDCVAAKLSPPEHLQSNAMGSYPTCP